MQLKQAGTVLAVACAGIYIVLVATCAVFVSSILLLGLLVVVPPVVIAAAKRDKRLLGMRAKAACWALGFLVLFMFPAFWLIPEQVYRRVNRQSNLITPGDPAVVSFAADFLAENPGFGVENFSSQMALATQFVLGRISWRLDLETHGLFGHVATPSEAISLGSDDCQGQACVLASMVIHLGFGDTWAVETPFHWYVVARDPALGALPAGWEARIEEYQHNGSIATLNRDGGGDMPAWRLEPVVLVFNDRETIYPVDPLAGLWISWTSTAFFVDDIFPLFEGTGIITIAVASLLMGVPLALYTSYMGGQEARIPRGQARRLVKSFLVRSLALGAAFFGILVAWYLLQPVIWDYTLIMAIGLVGAACTVAAEPWPWRRLKAE
ncbi:MAG: hypothetical protein JW839_00575 [Candidatus Lokiarchaeota archaeon]|nr:hypothetical protein [Candidatus Lokiarchaeota archaeon]